MTQELIVWPMIAMALATLWIYFPMSKARVASVKSGKTKASVYRLNIDEPEESLRFSNALRNQYESPILFYAVCLAALTTGNANMVIVILAFIYAAFKIAHIFIHTTSNRLRFRRPVFAISIFVLIVMWIALALAIAGIL